MRKAKLWSVLLASVLLCACIVGVLVVGANAGAGSVTYYVGYGDDDAKTPNFGSIREALVAAKEADWTAGDQLTIEFKGQDTSANVTSPVAGESANLLFGQTTIFAGDKKLPITIKGSGAASASIVAPAKKVACANDYAFEDLTYNTGDASEKSTSRAHQLFAGSGDVSFKNVTFTNLWARFYGDNFTKDAFAGWEELAEGEYAESSMSFLEGTSYPYDSYASGGSSYYNHYYLSVVGYNPDNHGLNSAQTLLTGGELNSTYDSLLASAETMEFQDNTNELVTEACYKPVNTKAILTVDPQNNNAGSATPLAQPVFTRVSVRGAYSPVAKATLNVRHVVSKGITGDLHSSSKNYIGDTEINLDGWTCSETGVCLRGVYTGCNLLGNFTVNIADDPNDQYTTQVQWIQTVHTSGALVTGNTSLNISGGIFGNTINANAYTTSASSNSVFGGASYGGTSNTISGGTFYSGFGGVFHANYKAGPIHNNVSGGVFHAPFVAGICGGSGSASSIENTITGGTFNGTTLSAPTFTCYSGQKGAFYGSNKMDTAADSVTNKISGTAVFVQPFYGVFCNAVSVVTNQITGGTFGTLHCVNDAYVSGSTTEQKAGREINVIRNTVSGGTCTVFHGGYRATVKAKDGIENGGTLYNTITGTAKITADAYGAYVPTLDDLNNTISGSAQLSSRFYAVHSGTINKSIQNTVEGSPTITNAFYGHYSGYASNADITNIIKGGVFKSTFDGTNGQSAKTVTNQISGGSFTGAWTGSNNTTIYGKTEFPIYNEISGTDTTFNNTYAGAYFKDKTGWAVKNKVSGGNFKGTCYMIGYGGSNVPASENEISGGNFTGSTTYFGCGSAVWPSKIASIKNTVTGGAFEGGVYGGAVCYITGNLENYILGGTFGKTGYSFRAGNYGPCCEDLNNPKTYLSANNFDAYGRSVGGKLINVYGEKDKPGPTFTYTIYSGDNYKSTSVQTKAYGAIENTVNSGNFASFYFAPPKDSFTGNGKEFVTNGEYIEATTPLPLANVTTTINGGTFNSSIYLGSNAKSEVVGTLHNTINGGTFIGQVNGGSGEGSTIGTITNLITGGKFEKTFRGGSYSEDADGKRSTMGDIQTTIEGGEFIGGVYLGGYTASTCGDLTNVIKGGNFSSVVYGGGYNFSESGNISNTIEGGVFSSNFYGGGAASSVVKNVTNLIKDGDFNYIVFFGGNTKSTCGDIKTDIQGGDFARTVYGGSYCESNSVATTGKISTTVTGGTFEEHFYGGSYNSGVNGNIVNDISNVTFASYYGGGHSNSVCGTVTNTLTDVTITNDFYGGGGTAVTTGDITTEITNGTFKGVVAAIHPSSAKLDGEYVINVTQTAGKELAFLGSTVEISQLTANGQAIAIGKNTEIVCDAVVGERVLFKQTEKWLAHNYFETPADVTLVIEPTDVVGMGETLTEGGKAILRGKSAAALGISLVLEDRISTKLYFAKDVVEAYGDDFSLTFTMGDRTVTAKKADLEDAGDKYAFVVTGIGLNDFGRDFTISGTVLHGETSSIVKLANLAASEESTWSAEWKKVAVALANLETVYEKGNHPENFAINLPATEPSVSFAEGFDPNTVFKSIEAGLVMGDAVAMRFTITMKEGVTLEDLTVTLNGTAGTVTEIEAGVYQVDFYFAVGYMSTNVSVVFADGQTEYLTYQVSVESLAYDLVIAEESDSVTAQTKENAKALLYYIQQVASCPKN